jgi:hypothetical protein
MIVKVTAAMALLFTVSLAAPENNPVGAGEGLAPGMKLPPLRGEYLTGEKAMLPDDVAGKTALIVMGFTYDSRYAVEDWTKAFKSRFEAQRNDVTFFEVPMIGGFARMGRWFIDSGMRKGTPKELHRNVITVYGGTGEWKKQLQFQEQKKDTAYLVLIDSQGVIRWMHAGALDESKFEELATVIQKLPPR